MYSNVKITRNIACWHLTVGTFLSEKYKIWEGRYLEEDEHECYNEACIVRSFDWHVQTERRISGFESLLSLVPKETPKVLA